MRILSLSLLVLLFLNSSCTPEDDPCQNPEIDLSGIEVETKITRLEPELFSLKDKDQVRSFLQKYPLFADRYMQLKRFPNDSIPVDQIYTMLQEPAMDTLYDDLIKKYPNLEELENEFNAAFKHIKYYYPDFEPPQIYTVISGLGSFFGGIDMLVSPDIIVISLDFFMGKDARYRPPTDGPGGIPDYIWKRYNEFSIVPICVRAISDKYNKTDLLDKTLVADMIYYGKAYHFVETMMPCLEDSILLGYSNSDLVNLNDEKNRQFIWNYFIQKELLFSTKEADKRDYLGERPYIAEIHKKCPGRIGQWFGLRIVQKFRKRNAELGFQEVMAIQKASDIFNKSGYQGD